MVKGGGTMKPVLGLGVAGHPEIDLAQTLALGKHEAIGED
jgi:hypothetical protein